MKKVLITGGAGFIGSYLCEDFLKRGWDVTAFDMADGRKIEHLFGRKNFHFVQNSILNKEALEKEVRKVGLVMHFAAIADPLRYVQDPLTTLQIDLNGSLNVLELCAEYGVKIAYASTSEIYGRNPRVPWKEDDARVLGSTAVNRWCYSSAKAVIEHYCFAYAQQKALRFVIYRFFNIYGPRLDDLGQGRVMPMMLDNFFSGKPVLVHGDGKQTRSFLYVDDAVKGIVGLALSKKAEQQVFNVGTGEETSILELAQMMKRVGKFASPVRLVPHEKVFGKSYEDVPRRVPDVGKIRRVLGWRAKTSLADGLKRTIDYYRKAVVRP